MEETVVPKENLYLITILNIVYIVSRTHDLPHSRWTC